MSECVAFCPDCGGKTFVRDKRNRVVYVARRRVCSKCGHRYSTAELHVDELKELKSLKTMIQNIARLK